VTVPLEERLDLLQEEDGIEALGQDRQLLLREVSELSPRRRDRFELPHLAGRLRPIIPTYDRMTVRSAVSVPTFRPTCPRFGNR